MRISTKVKKVVTILLLCSVIISSIINKKKGKTSCGCDCSKCSRCLSCKENKNDKDNTNKLIYTCSTTQLEELKGKLAGLYSDKKDNQEIDTSPIEIKIVNDIIAAIRLLTLCGEENKKCLQPNCRQVSVFQTGPK